MQNLELCMNNENGFGHLNKLDDIQKDMNH